MPSLNQLAARISHNHSQSSGGGSTGTGGNNNNAASGPSPTATNRPRLAAFAALRTGTNTTGGPLSASTTTTAADSIATLNGSTHSRSRSHSSTTRPSSPPQNEQQQETQDPSQTHPIEKTLSKLDINSTISTENTVSQSAITATSSTDQQRRMIKGYKNIPSLDAITARLAKTRALSIDGTAKPPEPELIEDPKSPGVPMKAPEHPLQYQWTIYHDTKAKFPYTPSSASVPPPSSAAATDPPTYPHTESTSYEANLTIVGEFSTVEQYCRYFNWLKPPSHLDRNSNYHLFKSGIKPMWEDPSNANGGKWVLTMKNNPALLDRCWSWLTMALVGEELEEGRDEICGAVVSLRTKLDRIQLWTRGKEDAERLNSIGKKLVKILDVSESDGIGLEFQYNTEDRPLPNKFLSIQSIPTTSSFRSSFQPLSSTLDRDRDRDRDAPQSASASSGGTGSFGNFSVGLGGTWKSRQAQRAVGTER